MQTKAFKEGLASCLYGDYYNPYDENSDEFDDYERGRSQKIKRSRHVELKEDNRKIDKHLFPKSGS